MYDTLTHILLVAYDQQCLHHDRQMQELRMKRKSIPPQATMSALPILWTLRLHRDVYNRTIAKNKSVQSKHMRHDRLVFQTNTSYPRIQHIIYALSKHFSRSPNRFIWHPRLSSDAQQTTIRSQSLNACSQIHRHQTFDNDGIQSENQRASQTVQSSHRHTPPTLRCRTPARLGPLSAIPLICIQHTAPPIDKHVIVQSGTKLSSTRTITHTRNSDHDEYSNNIKPTTGAPSN